MRLLPLISLYSYLSTITVVIQRLESLISLMSFNVWCIGTAIVIKLCNVFVKSAAQGYPWQEWVNVSLWVGSDPSLWAVQFQGHFPMRSKWLVCVFSGPGSTTVFVARGWPRGIICPNLPNLWGESTVPNPGVCPCLGIWDFEFAAFAIEFAEGAEDVMVDLVCVLDALWSILRWILVVGYSGLAISI